MKPSLLAAARTAALILGFALLVSSCAIRPDSGDTGTASFSAGTPSGTASGTRASSGFQSTSSSSAALEQFSSSAVPNPGAAAAPRQPAKTERAAKEPATATSQAEKPSSGGGSSTTKPEGTQATHAPSSYYAQKILELTNAERKQAGLSPLVYDKALEDAALIRVEEIKVLFSHTRPNGEPWNTVSSATNGENLAKGPVYIRPADVMYGWMHSEGHRKNILQPRFTRLGVAYSNGYWVQEFGV